MVSASVSVRKHSEGTVVDASLIYSVRFCMPEGKRHKEDNFTTGLRYDAKFIQRYHNFVIATESCVSCPDSLRTYDAGT